jgi:hypothetical protein
MKSILNTKNYLHDATFRRFIQEHLTDLAQKRQKLIDDKITPANKNECNPVDL